MIDASHKEINALRKLIAILNEALGKQKTKIFKGFGSSQSYYQQSTKESLGDPSPWDEKEDSGIYANVSKPVTVSRAFKKI